MAPRDWMIISFTFAVGILSGMYFYVTSYKPIYEEKSAIQDASSATAFSITGEIYGGLTPRDYVHPSFRIQGDGTYDYLAGGTGQPKKFSGKVSKNFFRAIQNEVASADLDALSTEVSNKSCALAYDGVEYTYTVDYDGLEYEFDTCATAFNHDTRLGELLLEVWKYMEAPDTYTFSITNSPREDTDSESRGLRGYFEDGFKEAGFE